LGTGGGRREGGFDVTETLLRNAAYAFEQDRPFRESTMNTTIDSTAFDKGTDPILKFFTIDQARQIVDFRGDAQLQARIEELAAKCNEGELSDDERAEYEGYVKANKFIAVLQAKVRKLLARSA